MQRERRERKRGAEREEKQSGRERGRGAERDERERESMNSLNVPNPCLKN